MEYLVDLILLPTMQNHHWSKLDAGGGFLKKAYQESLLKESCKCCCTVATLGLEFTTSRQLCKVCFLRSQLVEDATGVAAIMVRTMMDDQDLLYLFSWVLGHVGECQHMPPGATLQVSLSKQVGSTAMHISHMSGVVVAKCVGYLSLNWWCNYSQMHYQ